MKCPLSLVKGVNFVKKCPKENHFMLSAKVPKLI